MPELITPEEKAALDAQFEELRAAYDPDGTNGDDDESSSGDEGEGEDTGESGEEEDSVELEDGTKLTRTEIADLHRLRQFLDEDVVGNLRQTSQSLEQSRQQAPAVPASLQAEYKEPTPPPELDLDDPGIKALWEHVKSVDEQLHYQREELKRRAYIDATSTVERAVTDWNDKYKLDDPTIAQLRNAAAQSNVAIVLENQGKSPYDAVVGALEAAFWSDAKLRQQYLTAAAADASKTSAADTSRKKKLAALNGRGGSTSSHKPPAEMTREERNAAVVAELTAHLEGR